jgi:transcriptional regulator with PAS, ATPase and Fis domain
MKAAKPEFEDFFASYHAILPNDRHSSVGAERGVKVVHLGQTGTGKTSFPQRLREASYGECCFWMSS